MYYANFEDGRVLRFTTKEDLLDHLADVTCWPVSIHRLAYGRYETLKPIIKLEPHYEEV